MITRVTVITPTETKVIEPSKEGHTLEYSISNLGQNAILSVDELNVDRNTILQHIFKEWHTLAIIINAL